MIEGSPGCPNALLHEGYSNRMLTAPRFVREGNRLIPETALIVRSAADRTEGPRGHAPEPQRAERSDASSEDASPDGLGQGK